MYSKRETLENFRKFQGPLIDVRSPGEYYKGHMPNSINIPIFDNEERSIIGTIYKNNGRERAVIQGLEYIANKIEYIVNNIFDTIDSYKSKIKTTNIEDNILKIFMAYDKI